MTYEINSSLLVTDQPSHSQKVETEFILDNKNGRLELNFDCIRSKYIKVA